MEPFVYDVNFAGAIGDGESDDTEAFKNAWNIVCSSHISSGVFRVPYGQKLMVYSLPQVIHLHGNNNWITFQHFDGLIVQGTGSLHGQGQKWWQMGCMHNKV
ncbi:hypothetical protein Gohar_006269, partial [Gossypium harknessii]|nr:hypothetical protein [Gossypium harknessii]